MTDNRNLSSLSDAALQDPHIVWRLTQLWGCTPAEALAAKGAELRRRTQTTEGNYIDDHL